MEKPTSENGPGTQGTVSGFQLSEKTKLLLPLIGTVAALLVFLLVVWPNASHQRGRKAGSARNSVENGRGSGDYRGAGWRPDRPEKTAQGNSPVTGRTAGPGSPAGRGASQSGHPKDETWWYHEDGAKQSPAANDNWWYHD